MPQDPGTLVAQIKRLRGTGGDQPPQLPTQPQMPVAKDLTLTGILPAPTSPVMPAWPGASPASSSDLDTALKQEELGTMQYGRSQLAEEIGRIRGMTDQETRLREQQAKLKTGYEGWGQVDPKTGQKRFFEPVTGAGSLFKDIGRALLAVGASTGPGQAVENAIYSGPRRDYANLTQQIQDIRGAIEGEKEIVPSVTNAAVRPMMPATRMAGYENQQRHWQNQDNVALTKATEAQRHNLQTEAARLSQLRLSGDKNAIARQALVVRERIADMNNATRQYGIGAGIYENELDTQTREIIANELQAGGMARDHAYAFAAGMNFPTPQIPVRPTPNKPVPPAAGAGNGGRGGVQVTDPRGVVHTFPDQRSANNFKKAAGMK